MANAAEHFNFKVVRNNDTGVSRYFLNGTRVSKKEYQQVQSECMHQGKYDSLVTETKKHLRYDYASGSCPSMHVLMGRLPTNNFVN
jgi:hypothetical protein